MSKHLMMTLVSAVALAAGCQTGPNYNKSPQPLGSRSFARQWAVQLPDGQNDPVTELYVIDRFVFAYRADGSSTVIDRPTGRMLHRETPRGSNVRLHPPVLLKDRIVYPTTTYLEVYDFDGHYIPHPTRPSDETGLPASQDLKFAIHSDVVGQGNYVYFGADFRDSGRAVEVDLTRPYVPDLWTLMFPGSAVSAAPAVTKEDVFFAAENGDVVGVSIDNRTPVWQLPNGVFRTYGRIHANIAADDANLYIASNDTTLYCIIQKSGRLKWQYFSGQSLNTPPVLTKTMVYQFVPNMGLVAIEKNPTGPQSEAHNRNPRWIARDAKQFLSEDENYTYVATNDNHIAALDKKSGQVQFLSKRNSFSVFGVNTSGDGLIYTADPWGRVMVARPVLQGGGVGEIVMAPALVPLAMSR